MAWQRQRCGRDRTRRGHTSIEGGYNEHHVWWRGHDTDGEVDDIVQFR
jgi:hypothetical protein